MQQKRSRVPRTKSRSADDEPEALDRYAPASRMIYVQSLLATPGGATIDDLAVRAGVTTMTILRYRRAIENSGVIIDEEKIGREKRLRIRADSVRHEPVRLSTAHIMAMLLARNAMGFLRGTGFAEDFDEALDKMAASLQRKDKIRHLDRKIFAVNEEPYNYGGRANHVNEIVSALLHEEQLEVRHVTAGEERRRFLIDPYTLFLYKKGLYLAGFSHKHGEVRKFGLDALRAVTRKVGQKFEYPTTYKPASLLMGAFGFVSGKPELVRVHFDARVKRSVMRRKWHRSQRCTKLADGTIEVRLRVAPNFEVRNWVLSWGSNAEVIEPAALRAEVIAESAAMLARYRS